MKETGPVTSREYEENGQIQHGKSSDPKFYSSVYPEYWVPVQLSDVQLEQYCQTLFSKSLSLSSLSKIDLGALEETLNSVRKVSYLILKTLILQCTCELSTQLLLVIR
jgi:hypothetical protein